MPLLLSLRLGRAQNYDFIDSKIPFCSHSAEPELVSLKDFSCRSDLSSQDLVSFFQN